MNRIILAYAPENASLAESIDRQLSRIGIPFEHASSSLVAQIVSTSEPVLLLVTDNFLTNHACLEGLLPVLKVLASEQRLVAVIADGIDTNGLAIETHIDRMANALHYMKHWQDTWLALSDRYKEMDAAEKAAATAELDASRGIANEMGDIISTLREAGYLTWEQLVANDFEMFFQKFNLMDWHGQYRKLVAQNTEAHTIAESLSLPEMPIAGGILAPEPLPDPVMPTTLEPLEAIIPPFNAKDDLTETITLEEKGAEIGLSDTEIKDKTLEQQAAQDAWFWIEKGQPQRGLELFQMAIEQYPDSKWLKSEYEKAASQLGSRPPLVAPVQDEVESTTELSNPKDEAKSYGLMGDMAAERGDYMFAKYCWDRVVEIDPKVPNIYRKLGLMTAEHLSDYRETAAIYLRKALEIDPKDEEVKHALDELEQLRSSTKEVPLASSPEPSIIESENPVLEGESAVETTQEIQSKEIAPAQDLQTPKSPLVLITGATSGIGKATAEIFARNGYRLILTGRRVERLVALKNQFETEYTSEVLLLPFDVRDAGAVEAALSKLPQAFQEIDILINNAGLAKGFAPIHEGNLEHWETMIDTNLKGLLYVTRLVSPGMVRRRSGHIINVGSSAGKETYPNGNVYCATKFAVDALSKAMRFDLHAHNIRVSQVSPGHVEETEFAITRFDGDAERARIYNDFQPLKSSDVADAIYYMATRPAHVNIQDLQLFGTQQASNMVTDRSGR
ncbi:MAG: SDR family NAD(P)-dependent oxidoreductase [Saprospiraceae bacterium]